MEALGNEKKKQAQVWDWKKKKLNWRLIHGG